jgi:hypothetical protein
VLDEDPLELEKFKNYFSQLHGSGNKKDSKPISNLLLLNNNKEYNVSQDRITEKM